MVRAVAVLTGLAFAVACSDGGRDSGAPPDSADTLRAIDGPVMRYPLPSSDEIGMAAEVKGVLVLEGPCLFIAMEETNERFPVLWPAGTTWEVEDQAVVPPNGAPMPIGSSVYGGGGYLRVADVQRLAGSEAAALAAQCVDNSYGEIAVVNNHNDAIGLASN